MKLKKIEINLFFYFPENSSRRVYKSTNEKNLTWYELFYSFKKHATGKTRGLKIDHLKMHTCN